MSMTERSLAFVTIFIIIAAAGHLLAETFFK